MGEDWWRLEAVSRPPAGARERGRRGEPRNEEVGTGSHWEVGNGNGNLGLVPGILVSYRASGTSSSE